MIRRVRRRTQDAGLVRRLRRHRQRHRHAQPARPGAAVLRRAYLENGDLNAAVSRDEVVPGCCRSRRRSTQSCRSTSSCPAARRRPTVIRAC